VWFRLYKHIHQEFLISHLLQMLKLHNRSVKVLSDMNTPFESWKSWLLGLSPIPRSIDKLYRKSIESALEFWGMYQQKPAWYFNKKTQELQSSFFRKFNR
jgi:hypothetical protein